MHGPQTLLTSTQISSFGIRPTFWLVHQAVCPLLAFEKHVMVGSIAKHGCASPNGQQQTSATAKVFTTAVKDPGEAAAGSPASCRF